MGGAGRREIGHGALAERALLPVLPERRRVPVHHARSSPRCSRATARTSMASVCGCILSLMDAGVPIKAPVAGVAMGLITRGRQLQVLTDIQGIEDHLGDMDFKVAGTARASPACRWTSRSQGITDDDHARGARRRRARAGCSSWARCSK